MDNIYDQFTDYQGLDETLGEEHKRINHLWHTLGNIQGCNGLRFNLLYQVALYFLLLPHSNAEEERIFSTVAKNKTKYRPNLSNKLSLPLILTCKTNCFDHMKCFDFQATKSTLERAKKAATQYNAEHSK